MPEFKIPQGLAVVLSGYMKRMLESKYDQLSDLNFFDKLKEQSPAVKYGIEASLYALTAVMEQHFGEDTFFKKVFKEVGLDFGSEVSKRLINGDQLKAVVANNSGCWETKHEKELISILADLSEEDLIEFLDWLDSTTPEERKNMLRNISKLSTEEMLKVWEFKPSNRERLLKFSEKPPKKKGFWDTAMEPLNHRLDAYIQKNRREKDNE